MTRQVVSLVAIVVSLVIGSFALAVEPVKSAPTKKGTKTTTAPAKKAPAKSVAPAPTPASAATATPAKSASPESAPAKTTSSEPKPAAASTATTATPGSTYLLRYKFSRGEALRWEVEHQAEVKMTVSGTTQTADTFSKSVKLWEVNQVDRQGRATFIYSVDHVQMRQKLTGRQETTYDSKTDEKPPHGFQDVAKTVGKPLASITIDPLGKVISRDDLVTQATPAARHVTMPLPEEPIAIGFQWAIPDDINVKGRDEQSKKIQRRQQYTLEDVKNGIATIRVETQVLTPVSDPAIEAQLVQGETSGKIRFDIQAGRIDSQLMELDKHVVGVQGDSSSMHYVTVLQRTISLGGTATAAKPKVAGPALPPQ